MSRDRDSHSPSGEAVTRHYASGYEKNRLLVGEGRIDGERTRELLARFLPVAPATILDIGGGPGGHALWLARRGYNVHLLDITLLHAQMARKASDSEANARLASVTVGDAISLSWRDESMDGTLLFGPLYHLTEKRDRLRALREAYRVLRPKGVLLAVGISRFASTFDGLRLAFLQDPQFAEIVSEDLRSGQHRNQTGKPEYFMDTFFHHPDGLRAEVEVAGFTDASIYGVEGPSWLVHDLDTWWSDPTYRERLLQLAHALETEPTLLGISAHLMAVATK
jgi:ubiquinone/menaquinone biosynthesis C-methylase UbiE